MCIKTHFYDSSHLGNSEVLGARDGLGTGTETKCIGFSVRVTHPSRPADQQRDGRQLPGLPGRHKVRTTLQVSAKKSSDHLRGEHPPGAEPGAWETVGVLIAVMKARPEPRGRDLVRRPARTRRRPAAANLRGTEEEVRGGRRRRRRPQSGAPRTARQRRGRLDAQRRPQTSPGGRVPKPQGRSEPRSEGILCTEPGA